MSNEVKQVRNGLDAFVEAGMLKGEPTTIELAKSLVGSSDHVDITFKKPPEEKVRMESPARSHKFSSLRGFIAFLQKYGTENLVCLGDAVTGRMQAVLDDRAEKGFEVIEFEPVLHPLWKNWLTLLERPWPVSDLVAFLLGHRQQVIDPLSTPLIACLSQIRMSKKVDLQSGIGAKATNGLMVETLIQGVIKSQPVDFPDAITIQVPIFVDGEDLTLRFDLIAGVADNVVEVTITSSDAAVEKLERVKDMLNEAETGIGKGLFGLGQVNHRQWQYLS